MKKRQNRAWLALVALAALLLHAHPGAAFVTNMFIGVNGVQGFETYPGSPAPVYTPTNYADGWGASNVGIYSRLPIQPDVHSGSNSAWFNKYSTGESAISSPLLSNGAGTVTFWVKAASGTPTNWYALETSTDGSNWVLRDSIRANLTAASWTQFTGTVNRSESAFLRVRVTNELPNSIITKFDDLVISYPPAWVAITNAQSSPGIPNVNDPVSLTVTVVPDGLVSNITVTNFWSYNNGTTNSIAMLTNGVNGWITANAIPGQQAGMVKYYFVAYFQGPDAVSPSTSVTNQFTVNVPAYSSGYRQDSFRVQGGLNTNLWLVDSYSWLGVAQSSNAVTNALVKFRAETTNTPSTTNIWGDLTQSRTLFRIDGTANTSGPDIVIGGTNSGAFIFTFVETNLAYSIDHGVYQSFDAWPTNSATNAGWTSAAGRLIGDSNHTYRGQSAQLPTNGWIQTPSLTQGVGQVVFWYRDNPSNGSPATACRVQTSVDGTTWTNTITNVLVNGGVYQRFALTVEDRNSRYVRLLNDSTEQLCLDDVIVTDPFWAGVVFASLTNAPANPAATNAVTVSAVIAPMAGTSNLTAKLYYRSGSTGVYSMLAMTNSGTTYSNVVAIPPRIGPDGGAGLVQYFVGCTFEGYSSNITSPVYYPADTNNPSSYSIVRSYLVLTNAATLPVTPYTTNTITLGLDILPFAAASNIIATAYYRIGATGAFTSISMATTDGNHFATTSPVPAQSVPGTMLYYYFSATNDGANPIAPTNYPVGGTAAPLPVQIHAVPFSSVYTNLVVTGAGGLNPGMILVSNGLWQGVAQTTNLINPGFWFTGQNGGATNFGAAAQPTSCFTAPTAPTMVRWYLHSTKIVTPGVCCARTISISMPGPTAPAAMEPTQMLTAGC